MTDTRLSAVAVEALAAGDPEARLRAFTVEALAASTPTARAQALTVEVLIPATIPPVVYVDPAGVGVVEVLGVTAPARVGAVDVAGVGAIAVGADVPVVDVAGGGFVVVTVAAPALNVDVAGGGVIGIDWIPSDYPGPAEPETDLVAPIALERKIIARSYTYPAYTPDDRGRPPAGWKPE